MCIVLRRLLALVRIASLDARQRTKLVQNLPYRHICTSLLLGHKVPDHQVLQVCTEAVAQRKVLSGLEVSVERLLNTCLTLNVEGVD